MAVESPCCIVWDGDPNSQDMQCAYRNEISVETNQVSTTVRGRYYTVLRHHDPQKYFSLFNTMSSNKTLSFLLQVQNTSEIEKKIGCGQIEELIFQANNELRLVRNMLEWRSWESLSTEHSGNQWMWPPHS
ncbi:hypothetical protein QAD02_007919 [Eretmocerus hayati]|uniref:Uncharacterized protein n=1 Tax=Eretmocerus hayati TaxID=131215 RepID=A0ACC2N503_9HYME|nr:hypothetical protein QAD02_007919 [Eretmocerus hayati]